MPNHYRQSDGTKISKSTIDRKVREAKAQVIQNQLDNAGYNYCEVCERNSSDTYLDCSHTISVDECQKSGRAELAFDVNNIRVLCRQHHKEHDKI